QAASRSRSCGRSGTLTLRVTIVNSGYVSKANAISGSFKGTPTERCIINQFKSQSFPKFKNPALVETTYTVNL
ncbi:MAG: hypothetical protein II180_13540, partial [Proteobacteria bacterium]|nr:hypothetical protein [Pseudomonadota bacterium]